MNIKVLKPTSIFYLGNDMTVLLLFQKQSSRPGIVSERDRQDYQNDGIASTQGDVENLEKSTHRNLEPGNPLLTFLHPLLVLLSIKNPVVLISITTTSYQIFLRNTISMTVGFHC